MKRKVWVAKISYYDSYIVEPEDVGTLMYLSQRMQRVGGYPVCLDTDNSTPLCNNIDFIEVEFPENEVDSKLIPTPMPESF